jgi:hypothetical protein
MLIVNRYMARRLTDLEIAARIVPTMLRWPICEVIAFDRMRDGVEALRRLVRGVDDTCQQVERDRTLNPSTIGQRRTQIGDAALRELNALQPLQIAERAVDENMRAADATMQMSLTKARRELDDGVAAARRAVIERCQMRPGYPVKRYQ